MGNSEENLEENLEVNLQQSEEVKEEKSDITKERSKGMGKTSEETQNFFGKTSKLRLEVTHAQDKDQLSHVEFTAPFKIMKPFYDKKGKMSIMVMSSSAGVMSGDRQEISVNIGTGASCRVYSQSYDKIHKMEDGYGKRRTIMEVKRGGSLAYSPLPTIPYEGSKFQSETEIYLEDESARLVYSEILSAGRVARGERFAYERYDSSVRVYVGAERGARELVYYDVARYRPKEMEMGGFCIQEGWTHQSMMLLCHMEVSEAQREEMWEKIEAMEGMEGGLTQTESGAVVVRLFGNTGEGLEKAQAHLLEILNVLGC